MQFESTPTGVITGRCVDDTEAWKQQSAIVMVRRVAAAAEAQLAGGGRSARVVAPVLQELYNGVEGLAEEDVREWWAERCAGTQRGF